MASSNIGAARPAFPPPVPDVGAVPRPDPRHSRLHHSVFHDQQAVGFVEGRAIVGEAQPTGNSSFVPQMVELRIQPLPVIVTGEPINLIADLMTTSGQPVVDSIVILYLQSEQLQRRRTDAAGRATFSLPKEWSPGVYPLELLVAGSANYEGAIAAVELVIKPIQMTIEVIPPLAGIRFAIGDQEITSDATGHAYLPIQQAGRYTLTLLTPREDHADYRFEFERWETEIFDMQREIVLPEEAFIQVGFSVSYQATPSFTDLDGNVIDPKRIESLTFQSSNGASLELDPKETYWLQANRVMRRSTGLEEAPIQYSLQSVVIDGADVVNRGQQKFFAGAEQAEWPIELIFYPAKFRAQDALFGQSIGTGINLTYPNGQMVFYPFDKQGEVSLAALPRGAYQVQVAGAPGMAPVTPVAISRFQDVDLLVVSQLDMGLFVGCGVLLALALLLFGRPTLLTRFILRRPAPVPAQAVPGYLVLRPGRTDEGLRLLEEMPNYYQKNANSYKTWVAKRDDLWLLNNTAAHRQGPNISHERKKESNQMALE